MANNKLNILISSEYINDILQFNRLYCKEQIKHINLGIQLIEDKKIYNNPTDKQIKLAIEWCNKYNIKLNNSCLYFKSGNSLSELLEAQKNSH